MFYALRNLYALVGFSVAVSEFMLQSKLRVMQILDFI